jgi:hypothetical protein
VVSSQLDQEAEVSAERREALQIVMSRGEHLRDEVYGTYTKAVTTDAKYYELAFADNLIPKEWRRKGLKPVVPATAYNAVENAADHVLKTPLIRVPIRPTDQDHAEEQEIAERKRLALRFWWETIEIDHGNPIAAAVKSLVKDGKMVLKKDIKWHLIPDDVDDTPIGLDEFPWTLQSLPPESVYEDPDRPYDPMYLYEHYNITTETALDAFPDGTGGWTTKAGHEMVEVMEYWSKPGGTSRGLHIIFVDGDPAVDEENPYHWARVGNPDTFTGYIPYVIRASGWGERKKDYDPEAYYVGILRRMRSLLDAQAQHYTDGSTQMKMSTFPATVTTLPESVPIRVGPGEVTRKRSPDDTVEFLAMPQLPASLFQTINLITEETNAISKFGALGGVALRGVDTATESDAVVRNAAAKLNSPVLAMRSAMQQINRMILQDVENVLGQPVMLFGAPNAGESLVVLAPDEISGFYHTTVELSTTDKAALDRANTRNWMDLYRSFPGLSEQTAMTNIGIEDPQQEQDARLSEDTFRAPEMAQVRTFAALAGLGGVAEEVLAAFRARLQGEAQQAAQGAASDGTQVATGAAPVGAPQAGDQLRAGAEIDNLEQRADQAFQ